MKDKIGLWNLLKALVVIVVGVLIIYGFVSCSEKMYKVGVIIDNNDIILKGCINLVRTGTLAGVEMSEYMEKCQELVKAHDNRFAKREVDRFISAIEGNNQ